MSRQKITPTPVLTMVATMAGAYDRSRIHTAILAPISDNIDRDQLKRGNIQDQKRTHLVTCRTWWNHSGPRPHDSFLYRANILSVPVPLPVLTVLPWLLSPPELPPSQAPVRSQYN